MCVEMQRGERLATTILPRLATVGTCRYIHRREATSHKYTYMRLQVDYTTCTELRTIDADTVPKPPSTRTPARYPQHIVAVTKFL